MKRLSLIISSALIATYAYADQTPSTCIAGDPQTSPAYQAVQWYRDSAEKNAIDREVFFWGGTQIKNQVKTAHLRPKQWGVILDIDDTVLDNSIWSFENTQSCKGYNKDSFSVFQAKAISKSIPGAAKLTCSVQKMGGYVTFISNRDGSYVNPNTQQTLLQATIDNLKKEGMCFNQVIIAKNAQDKDKNPRFEAVQSGIYPAGMVYSNTLPKHSVIAYFGDNIQDFPKTYQTDMMKQDANGAAYDEFGQMYFALPNPTYGSWQTNAFQ